MDNLEWKTRVDLAAAFRLVDLYGWSDMLATHLSARIPGPNDHFLINPMGMLFEEITASVPKAPVPATFVTGAPT